MSIESVVPSNYLILCHPFFSCPQSFPASGSFPVSQFFTSGSQSIGASASASVLPVNIQGWLPLGLTGLISLQSKGLSRVFSITTVQKNQFFVTQPSYGPALTWLLRWLLLHDYWKNHCFDYMDLSWQNDGFVFFNMLSRFFIAFLLRSKCLSISWLQSPSTVFWSPRKSATISTVSPSICHEWWDRMPWS